VERLRERRLLLLIDNCEHLLPACAELAAALLHGTTGVRILATSRHRLGLTEEHLLDVRPLPVPDPDGDLTTPEGYPALALFADRAAAVVPGFRLTAANRGAVARLCRRLDGLPLAIELAAVRMRVLDVDQLLDRLDDRYRLLTGGSPAALPRHQTLRAAVDWSHELCDEREQLVWARLSVLAGAFDLETAEAVCAQQEAALEEAALEKAALEKAALEEDAPVECAAPLRSYDVLDAVTGLVDKSVLSRESGPPSAPTAIALRSAPRGPRPQPPTRPTMTTPAPARTTSAIRPPTGDPVRPGRLPPADHSPPRQHPAPRRATP
jgi:hypothetical protein